MKKVFETPRLRIRTFGESDFENLFKLDSDPEVMRYISDGRPMTSEEVKATLQRIISKYAEWKVYGVWAAEKKDSNEFIGWFSLKPLPGTSEVEIGYRLLRNHWGQGYATEGAEALLKYGLRSLGLKKIVAITNTENMFSKKVLQKIGLKPVDDRKYQSSPTSPEQIVTWFEIFN